MRKMLYILTAVLLISTGVEAKNFDHQMPGVPQRTNQTIIVNNYQTHFQKPGAPFYQARKIQPDQPFYEPVRVCHKKDKTALKIAAVSAGVIGTVALVAALAN